MYITANTNPATTTNITMPQLQTPPDVERYLRRMDFDSIYGNNSLMWKRKDFTGYMTWEQAVVYCLVKPWLVEEA
jgi:hypothetical protein